MKNRLLLISLIGLSILFIPFVVAAEGSKWPLPKLELRELNKTLEESDKYSNITMSKIDSLVALLRAKKQNSVESIDMLNQISGRYRPVMADSSLAFALRAVDASKIKGDHRLSYQSSLSLADALSASGFFSQAIQCYDTLSRYDCGINDRIRYFSVGRRLYSNLSNYMEGRGPFTDYYRRKYEECDDSLMRLMPAKDPFVQFIICERLVSSGKNEEALPRLQTLLSRLKKGDNLYGMTAYQVAVVYKGLGDPTQYAAYLAKAADSDVRGSIREGLALPALAAWLYEQGALDYAFNYINFALEDAYKGNARVRMVSMGRWVPQIGEAYRQEISTSRVELIIYGVLTSIILLALATILFFLIREHRKNKAREAALTATSKIKDKYIGNFIDLCSTYSEKYQSLVSLIDRKVSSGQAQDLLKIAKTGKMADAEDSDFYKIVDKVVLELYPDFIESLNTLLLPQERIILDPKSRNLTPELRICAFMRLGVMESTRIARILNYSVHTVYSYRNRMRNRAINRETFDEDVRSGRKIDKTIFEK